MTLEGGINFNETADYIIYTMNSPQTGQYCTILPKNTTEALNMLVDFHKKSSFDKITNGSITKEQLIEELTKEYSVLKEKYPNSILVFPMMNEEILTNAIENNDKQKMFDETKKISAITSELYKKLIASGIEKQKINQQIMIVETSNQDTQFVNWLKEQMPNFVEGIDYNQLNKAPENTNPFMSLNPFAQEPTAPVEPPKPTPSSIFDSPAPTVPEPQPEPIPNPVPEPPKTNDPFAPVGPVAPEQPLAPVEPQVSEPTPEPAPFFEAPKPVENKELEATMTLNQIPESETPKEEPTPEEEHPERKASQGFANLIILIVILIGVTIASIELGKFLYSVYGA